MQKDFSSKIIDQIQKYFADKPVNRAYLFGSFARGEADEKSDVDLLLDLDHSKPIGLYFFKMHLELQDRLGRRVDMATRNSISKFVLPNIEKDLKLIYEK